MYDQKLIADYLRKCFVSVDGLWFMKVEEDADFEKALESLRCLPGRKAVNPLFSFLYHSDDLIRWHAVSAMGLVVSDLADNDMESARIVMRRLIWNLNDESGGIGWGSPEAMGETMAQHAGLARLFAAIGGHIRHNHGRCQDQRSAHQQPGVQHVERCMLPLPEMAD